jgi:hypothetical protein
MFEIAFTTTCSLIIISMVFYLYSIPDNLIPKCNYSMPVIMTFWCDLLFINSVLPMVANFLCRKLMEALVKLLWPLIHIWRRMQYLASLRSSECIESNSESDKVWANIKAVEYGVESSLQLLLQLWLLNPFLSDISTWSLKEIIDRCGTGLANFITFDTYPACYIEKALGKILLTIITFSLGVAQMKSYKPGQDTAVNPSGLYPFFSAFWPRPLPEYLL